MKETTASKTTANARKNPLRLLTKAVEALGVGARGDMWDVTVEADGTQSLTIFTDDSSDYVDFYFTPEGNFTYMTLNEESD